MFNKPKVDRAKGAVKDEGKGKNKILNPKSSENKVGKGDPTGQARETPTVLDDYGGSKENGNKRVILQILGDVADLHERVTKCVDVFFFLVPQLLDIILVFLYGADQNLPINMAVYV